MLRVSLEGEDSTDAIRALIDEAYEAFRWCAAGTSDDPTFGKFVNDDHLYTAMRWAHRRAEGEPERLGAAAALYLIQNRRSIFKGYPSQLPDPFTHHTVGAQFLPGSARRLAEQIASQLIPSWPDDEATKAARIQLQRLLTDITNTADSAMVQWNEDAFATAESRVVDALKAYQLHPHVLLEKLFAEEVPDEDLDEAGDLDDDLDEAGDLDDDLDEARDPDDDLDEARDPDDDLDEARDPDDDLDETGGPDDDLDEAGGPDDDLDEADALSHGVGQSAPGGSSSRAFSGGSPSEGHGNHNSSSREAKRFSSTRPASAVATVVRWVRRHATMAIVILMVACVTATAMCLRTFPAAADLVIGERSTASEAPIDRFVPPPMPPGGKILGFPNVLPNTTVRLFLMSDGPNPVALDQTTNGVPPTVSPGEVSTTTVNVTFQVWLSVTDEEREVDQPLRMWINATAPMVIHDATLMATERLEGPERPDLNTEVSVTGGVLNGGKGIVVEPLPPTEEGRVIYQFQVRARPQAASNDYPCGYSAASVQVAVQKTGSDSRVAVTTPYPLYVPRGEDC